MKTKNKVYAEVSGDVIWEDYDNFCLYDGDRKYIIPKDLVNEYDNCDIMIGDCVDIEVEEWFAIENGMV